MERRFKIKRSYSQAIAEKETGIERTLEANTEWRDRAFAAVRQLPLGWTGTGEDIRVGVVRDDPKSPNAWGGLINRAIKAELLRYTGEYKPMTTPKSHGRRTPVYERVAA